MEGEIPNYDNSTMERKIWFEFEDTRFGDEYLQLYINRIRTQRSWLNFIVLLVSGSGILAWKKWDSIPVWASVIVFAIQILRLVENQLLLSDKDLEKIVNIRNMYYQHWNDLERLWVRYFKGNISEDLAEEEFYKLRDYSKKIKEECNKIRLNDNITSLMDKAANLNLKYIKKYHH